MPREWETQGVAWRVREAAERAAGWLFCGEKGQRGGGRSKEEGRTDLGKVLEDGQPSRFRLELDKGIVLESLDSVEDSGVGGDDSESLNRQCDEKWRFREKPARRWSASRCGPRSRDSR